jgi:hypothetical protein
MKLRLEFNADDPVTIPLACDPAVEEASTPKALALYLTKGDASQLTLTDDALKIVVSPLTHELEDKADARAGRVPELGRRLYLKRPDDSKLRALLARQRLAEVEAFRISGGLNERRLEITALGERGVQFASELEGMSLSGRVAALIPALELAGVDLAALTASLISLTEEGAGADDPEQLARMRADVEQLEERRLAAASSSEGVTALLESITAALSGVESLAYQLDKITAAELRAEVAVRAKGGASEEDQAAASAILKDLAALSLPLKTLKDIAPRLKAARDQVADIEELLEENNAAWRDGLSERHLNALVSWEHWTDRKKRAIVEVCVKDFDGIKEFKQYGARVFFNAIQPIVKRFQILAELYLHIQRISALDAEKKTLYAPQFGSEKPTQSDPLHTGIANTATSD